MANTSWADLNKDGRRVDRIIKICESLMQNELKKDPSQREYDLVLSFIDRLNRLTETKAKIVDTVLGVKKLRKEAEKLYA